ncbi:hypothetical protein B9L23_16985 [Parageobacillus galactosidasius]|uniref:Uncharacterized protein n=1 Tax=Parageobacillus galactosidasius TaxID=883812 RepID=A0A226QKD4_9BACL|nr:hypothetical protein B9L23_16985 [Parageobacillus galactosidasius]
MFALFQHLYHIYILKQPFLFLAKNGRYSYKCKCFSREHPPEAHCFSCGRKAGFIFSVYIEFFVQYKYTGFRKVGESRMLCTLKIKLMPTLEQFHALLETMKRFNQACNYISEIAFRSRTFSKTKIQRL